MTNEGYMALIPCTCVVFIWPGKLLFRTWFVSKWCDGYMDIRCIGLTQGSCFAVESNIQEAGKNTFIFNKP